MKAVKIVLISLGGILVTGIFILICIGANSPETYIYTGNEIPSKYRRQLNELSLIESDESIIYMYSDALFDIKEGVYILTNKHLIIYLEEWEDPRTIIEFEEIDFLDIEYDNSFFNDSFISVETDYGMTIEFPVSSERGRDRDFFKYLQKKVIDAHSTILEDSLVME